MPVSRKKKHAPKRKKCSKSNGDYPFLKHLKPVQPDESFNYRCNGCADCCHGINLSVGLEPLDVFRLSRYLKKIDDPNWRIEDILSKHATMMPLTDFGYPMFFINTTEPGDACVFLKSGKCSVYPARPRTCRMYPLTAEPLGAKQGYNYYIITERKHHYEGPDINVGVWMDENINAEDREFTDHELTFVPVIGRLMKRLEKHGIATASFLAEILFMRYFNFDIEEPFVPQYLSNNTALLSNLLERCGYHRH